MLVIEYGGREARTQVVDKGPYSAGHEFDLTQPLAADLGVRRVATVRWRFASG